ncbi:hypothetical protein BXZ70DRAFT_1004826 [Cristinia sonorae]|uniref:F-box domain-containing protein n=1 Tax=Cristinia sonorae TaxID=1940300 RepID=A0A8K0XTW9_9AGAR|nr:hypothetical protein BXZ70DRAFT_1004826 [Cristinia sonorae]
MRLPPELNDLTLDHLHDDKAALARCALVCRDWTHSVRHHLWNTIQLKATMEDITLKLVHPLATPEIAFHVRNIVVASESPIGKVRGETDMHILHHILSLLSHHPHLQSFTLRNITFSPNVCDGDSCTALRLPSIRKLSIVDVAFDALQDVQWLWCMFPSADRLQLDRVWWTPWSNSRVNNVNPCQHTPRPSYKEFALGHCCSRDTVAKWLLGMSPSLDIQTLRLPLVGIHDVFLADLLRGIGVSLHHLEMGSLGHVKNSTRYKAYLDFSANTELKSISIGVPMYRDPATVLEWMTAILSQIVSTTVTHITFSIFPVHKSQNPKALLDNFDWEALVFVLQRPQFARLSNIIFRLAGQTDYLKYPHNFAPLSAILPDIITSHFDPLLRRGVDVSIL